MIRMTAVLLAFAAGTVWGLNSVVGAGCLLVWNDIFRPTAWAWYYGALNPAYFPTHHYCFAILCFALLFTKWKKRWNVGTSVILFLILWTWLSTSTAVFRDQAVNKAIDATKYLFPTFIMSIALVERRYQLYFLYTLAYSVGIWLAWSGLHTAVIKGAPEIRMSIPGGQMTDRNDFLVAGTACLPLLAYVGWFYEGRWRKWIRLGTKIMVLFSAFAFFGSLSRGAIVGLSTLLIFYALGTGRILKRVGILIVLVAIALPLIPDQVWERMSTIELSDQQSEASAYHRIVHMKSAVAVTLDHPLTGVGPQNFPRASLGYQPTASEPHTIWLKCSAEFGLPMFFVFVGIVLATVGRLLLVARRARRAKDRQTEGMATALGCALVGFLATGSFTSQFTSEYLWSIIALCCAFLAAEKVRSREPLHVPEPARAGESRERNVASVGNP